MNRLSGLIDRIIRRETSRKAASPEDVSLRHVVLGLSKAGAAREQEATVRRAGLMAAKALRAPERMIADVAAIMRLEAATDEMLAAHVTPEDVRDGRGGTFDSCDLRHWLVLAERAGVGFVPAREILTLSSEEVGALQGPVAFPDHVLGAIGRGVAAIAAKAGVPAPPPPTEEDVLRMDALARRAAGKAFEAGDLIPPGHVVRSAICGPGSMKALAGTGTLRDQDTSASMKGTTVGCGWVRQGNATRIDVTDERITSLQARGHEDTFRFLVRPWVDAGRRNAGVDPHFGTAPNAAQSWPAEWRVYVKGGEAIGVGNYYAWAGDVSPESARGALAAKAAAERIIAEVRSLDLLPVTTDLFISHLRESGRGDDIVTFQNDEFPADGLHFTLDFIEGPDGEPILLEGGPPHLPAGMAHPTAFSGIRLREDSPGYCDVRGVALRLADGVDIGDVRSWRTGLESHALSFEDAEALARGGDSPEP
ncbi:MAG: hypothetical protein DI629_20775 [Mesorhizobium amorphae]|nr:MAG: hypothetical protein DI629_20775 [Mesorhizobium amorphae]